MTTYAIVENGLVTNIIVWDGIASFTPPNGSTLVKVPDGTYTGPGATYSNGIFGPPPQTLSMD